MAKTFEVTVSDETNLLALAGILEMYAAEKRTPSGAVSRSGKGSSTYVAGFRETLMEVAAAARAAS